MIDITVRKMVNLYGRSDFMTERFDAEQIRELMKSFYTLSGIRFVLFDTDYKEIIAYPEESCAFCSLIKGCPQTRRRCNYADRRSFEKCEKAHSAVTYKCHAGLVEAVIPLYDNEKLAGYLMFGQITDEPDKKALYEKLDAYAEKGIDRRALQTAAEDVAYKSETEIQSAAKIMEACTSYIILKELITPDNDKLFVAAKEFIEAHLGEDVSVEQLCAELGISRTRLYEIFRSELKMGISRYILIRRLHRAKKLLKTTELPVSEIAVTVGFADYNYFSRVYKKRYGKSPHIYRKTQKKL